MKKNMQKTIYIITEQQLELLANSTIIQENIELGGSQESANNKWSKNPESVKQFLIDKGYVNAWDKYNGDLLKIRYKFAKIFKGKDRVDFLKLFGSKRAKKQNSYKAYAYDMACIELEKLTTEQLVDKFIAVLMIPAVKEKTFRENIYTMDSSELQSLRQQLIVQIADKVIYNYTKNAGERFLSPNFDTSKYLTRPHISIKQIPYPYLYK